MTKSTSERNKTLYQFWKIQIYTEKQISQHIKQNGQKKYCRYKPKYNMEGKHKLQAVCGASGTAERGRPTEESGTKESISNYGAIEKEIGQDLLSQKIYGRESMSLLSAKNFH